LHRHSMVAGALCDRQWWNFRFDRFEAMKAGA